MDASIFASWHDYWHFQRRVISKQRFIRGPEDAAFLDAVFETSKKRHKRLKKDSMLWRAQVGHGWREEKVDRNKTDSFPGPMEPQRMKPLPQFATNGRTNVAGIPHLYLATEKKTAISEVRPWVGSLVSCALFRIKRNLVLVDFSTSDAPKRGFYFKEPSAKKRVEAVWTDIDLAFSQPVLPTDSAASYVPTQIIAELFKSKGLDGVAYRSSCASEGFNICLFDLSAAELEYCELHEVKQIEISTDEACSPYWIEKDHQRRKSRAKKKV